MDWPIRDRCSREPPRTPAPPELVGRSGRDGNLARAATLTHTCSELDPERAVLWQRRQEEIATAATSSPLAVQCAIRLAVAGTQHDDPGLQQIREWNAAVRARTAQPEPEAGS
jgi:hypothetical protein